MMKGFNASGNFRAVNPGQFLCIGVDDPRDLPLTFVSGAMGDGDEFNAGYGGESNIQSGYFLFNNFSVFGDFASLEQLTPSVAFVSTAPAGQPSSATQNDVTAAWAKGTVPFGTGINRNLGCNIAGRNFAVYQPRIKAPESGTTYYWEEYLRSQVTPNLLSGATAPDQLHYKVDLNPGTNTHGGWVIDNHGELMSKNTDEFPQRYSNCAAWSGRGSVFNSAQDGAVSGNWYQNTATVTTGGDLVKIYNGFSWLPVNAGTSQVTGKALGSGGSVNMGTGTTANWLSTDGFTQKGFVKIDIDQTSNTGSSAVGAPSGAAFNKYSRFAPRENILCSAKILSVPGTVGIESVEAIEGLALIEVDDTSIFNANADDRYVIYRMGHTEDAWKMLPNSNFFTPSFGGAVSVTNNGNCSGALGYHSMVKLSNINQPIQGSQVALTVTDDDSNTLKIRPDGILRADDGTTELCIEGNLHNLWISPLKYWINLGFFENPDGSPTSLSRSYESICAINERPADGQTLFGATPTANFSGSTFNEFLYTYTTGNQGNKGESSLLSNPWILAPAPEGGTSLDLQDFGYGDFSNDSQSGGQAGVKSAWNNTLNYIPIDGVVTADKRKVDGASEPIVLTLGLSDLEATKTVTLYGDEYGGDSTWASGTIGADVYKPTFIWHYYDKLPNIKDFQIKPTVDVLKEGVNLYDLTTANLNSVNFTWSEESEGDIWYRMLMVDTETIPHKYHKARVWAPLNEQNTPTAVTTAVTKTWYADISTNYGLTVSTTGPFDGTKGSEVLQTIDGLSGFSSFLLSSSTAANGILGISGSATAGTEAANTTEGLRGLSEYTFVIHVVPEAANNRLKYVFSQGNGGSSTTNAGGFDCSFSNLGQIVVRHSGTAMTGTTACPADGETPTSVIVTYSSGASARQEGPDLQMFVNGKRENYVINSSLAPIDAKDGSATENILFAADFNSANIFKGKIEEVIIYEKAWKVVETENQYTLPTTALADTNSSNIPLTNNAKLFLFDYHNIRGKEATEVCESNQISWRTTS